MQRKYEIFHEVTKKQRRIISKKDFTFKEALKQIKRQKIVGKTILDVGCGTGAIDFFLASTNNEVTGIDISRNAISACKRDAKLLGVGNKTKFYVLDLNKERINEKFDVVLCLEIIEHIKNDTRFLKIVAKNIKKNGIMILSTPSINAPLYKLGLLRKFDERVGHLRRYRLEEIKKLILSSGFKIVEVSRVEGLLRNFLFTSNIGKFPLRVINKLRLGPIVSFLDRITLKIFGESDFIVVAKKK